MLIFRQRLLNYEYEINKKRKNFDVFQATLSMQFIKSSVYYFSVFDVEGIDLGFFVDTRLLIVSQ